MDIVLLTTVDVSGTRMTSFNRLIGSILDNITDLPATKLTLRVVLQNCGDDQASCVAAAWPSFVKFLSVDRRISLSAARNMLIRAQLEDGGFGDAMIVGFPDDDAWYPSVFLAGLVRMFESCADLDFWFCRYGTMPRTLPEGPLEFGQASRQTVMRKSSSNTIFVRGSVAEAVGQFDEKLGLGTALGSGEDVDYAARVFARARRSSCLDQVLVGHRDKVQGLRGKYYRGSLFVLARHGSFIDLARKFLIGLYLTLKGELGMGGYISAIRAACDEVKRKNAIPS